MSPQHPTFSTRPSSTSPDAARVSGSLTSYVNSDFVAAANRLGGREARKKIVVYVEGYDDVLFWSSLLRPLENEHYYFEVMLPSQTSLGKGKKVAIANNLGPRLGKYMIACVDADYDYLLQGATPTSQYICGSPYIFHTIAYSIESFRCYAPALHNVCVMATLNDTRLFDFEEFLGEFSRIVFPLFAWNVWAYRYGHHSRFSLQDFFKVVALNDFELRKAPQALNDLRRRVNVKIDRLHHLFPEGRKTYKPLCEELQRLGVTPETAYMYMRGHDVLDGVVAPLVTAVCERLRRQRESEIRRLARHQVQMQNELSGYQHAIAAPIDMLRKHTGYTTAPQFEQIEEQIRNFLKQIDNESLPQNSKSRSEAEDFELHKAE